MSDGPGVSIPRLSNRRGASVLMGSVLMGSVLMGSVLMGALTFGLYVTRTGRAGSVPPGKNSSHVSLHLGMPPLMIMFWSSSLMCKKLAAYM